MSENIWKISGISVRPENVPKRDRFRHPGNIQKVSGNRPESVQKTRFFTRSLERNISGSSDWIHAVLDLFESQCLALSVYKISDRLVRYT